MLDTEYIKTLKEKVISDTFFSFENINSKHKGIIFSNYKKIITIEDSLNNHMVKIKIQKDEISKNLLHDNSKVRAIFSKYINMLNEVEEILFNKKDELSSMKNVLIENFSSLFEEV